MIVVVVMRVWMVMASINSGGCTVKELRQASRSGLSAGGQSCAGLCL